MSCFLEKKYREKQERKNLNKNIFLLIVALSLFFFSFLITNFNRNIIEGLAVSKQEIKEVREENEILTLEYFQSTDLEILKEEAKKFSLIPPSSISWIKLEPDILVESGVSN